MIYTVTLNPSVDYIVKLDSFALGSVNRANYEAIVPGGKGINVSVMLHQLGVESTALGFVAGFTGDEIRRSVRALGCKESFIPLSSGFSRINVKMKTDEESEINGAGPQISNESLEALTNMLETLSDGDILVLSGSVPRSVPKTIYGEIARRLEGKGVNIAVDASGELLLDVLPCRPFLIKPNHHELGELFGVKIQTADESAYYAKRLREKGARNVLVSMAGEGAMLAAEDGFLYTAKAPSGNVINSVGAGDSMLAGFLAGYLETGDWKYALRLGIAAGSASAFSEGIASRDVVFALFSSLKKDDICICK